MKYAVIGDPIAHSLSPSLHLPVLSAFDKEAQYEKVHVIKGELAEWIKCVKKESFRGFNITMPHKQDILPYLDDLSRDAAVFRSVNTVVQQDGKLIGYSTDADGFLQSLKEAQTGFAGKRLLLLGAGGAARTLALKAVLEDADEINVLARNLEQAERLCQEMKHLVPGKANERYRAGTLSELESYAATGPDLLIQATSIGMEGCEGRFADFEFLRKLPQDTFVSDLIYHPRQTELLKEASRLGLKAQNGLKMLQYQALFADSLFLEKPVDDLTPFLKKEE